MKYPSILLLSLMFFAACSTEPQISADTILEKSIEAAGGEDFFHSTISFSIEDYEYVLKRDGYLTDFSLTREIDTTIYFSTYKGGLMHYYVNGVEEPESMQSRKFLDARLDGFTFLSSMPHVFNENGTIVERLENVTIQQKEYYTLRITYKHQEGMEDRNIFYLYIDPDTFYIDYVAFKLDVYQNFQNFRRNYNRRKIEGILFSDFYSFYPHDQSMPLDSLYHYYNKRDVREGPATEYKNISVEIQPYE
ncbi:MAG: hypothetical protein HKM28_05925 [Flavobacteriaceae bacterium]|nr:hypothetical protein [Flavobacteriaceae bacterium]